MESTVFTTTGGLAAFVDKVSAINDAINGFVWGLPMLVLLMLAGLVMTLCTGFFQITHFKHWWSQTVGGIFAKKGTSANGKSQGAISQFQALCTALAATVGVGNIAGVATAIASGGPGAIFWMWLAAFLGMMTHYAENVLGVFYRVRNQDGEWSGGPMYYLKHGLGAYPGCKQLGRVLAVLFSIFAVCASFGIGNAGQVNTISLNISSAFGIPPYVTGIVLMILAGLVVLGGLQRIAQVTEKFVPTMVVLYLVGTIAILVRNAGQIIPAFGAIFSFAFGIKAVGGAAMGLAVRSAITWGLKRGVFSNEAGLGSSVMVHATSHVREPAKQGMWGIFEVFTDTIVVCTLTALTILTSGLIDLQTGKMLTTVEDSVLISTAFANAFGVVGSSFIAIAILLFAFSTVLGWSCYGTKAWEYLFGTNSTILYKIVFVAFIFVGATMKLGLAWQLSDTFNGLMSMPNLIGVISLTPMVIKITRNYIDRVLRGKQIDPLLSAHPEIQKKQEEHS